MRKLFRKKLTVVEIGDSVLTATERQAARVENIPRSAPFVFLWWIAVGILCLFFVRVIYLTVVRGDELRATAHENSIRHVPVKAPRGKVYDRFGVQLVHNVPSRNAIVETRFLPEQFDERKKILSDAVHVLNLSQEQEDLFYEEVLSGAQTILLKENILQEEALQLHGMAQQLPGVGVEKAAVRRYSDGAIFSHVIGYEGKIKPQERQQHPTYLLTDRIGKDGIEKTYDSVLRGVHGSQRYVVDARGTIVREADVERPILGSDVYLTIDAGLQKKLFDSVADALERSQTRTAAAVAIDPRSGAVRALVSLPSYDNNSFVNGISQQEYTGLTSDTTRPLFNRVIGGTYAPGSTIKPAIAAAALSENIIDPTYKIESRGGIQVGSFFFGDWRAHGFTDMRRAIAVSSDVYFYSIGGGYGGVKGLGMELMKKYENLFGYGVLSGIDLPGESAGFIPDPAWKEEYFGEKWYIGNSYHASIGQGFITATPLQVANVIATVASGGTRYVPHVVSHTISADGETTFVQPEVAQERFVDEEHIKIVQEGMRQTITDGTATYLKDLPVAVAGKTGTAQFGGQDEKVHSWFVSYAPYENPEIVLVVLMEGQTEKVSSSTVPITKNVYEWYFGGRGDKNNQEGDIVENNEQKEE